MSELRDMLAGLLSTIPNQPSHLHPEEQRQMADAILRVVREHALVIEQAPDLADIAFAIGQAVRLDDDAVRANPMMLHDAARAVLDALSVQSESQEASE